MAGFDPQYPEARIPARRVVPLSESPSSENGGDVTPGGPVSSRAGYVEVYQIESR